MKKLMILLLATLLFLTACSAASYSSKWDNVPELLYEVDGAVYAANGAYTTRLYADEHYVFSFETGRYYYLDHFNTTTSTGDLMAADGSGQPPTLVDMNVCEVKMSQDGSRVLYLKDITDGTGTLYSWSADAETEMISEDVPLYSEFSEGSYGFSPNGAHVYFTTEENNQYTLFVKTGQVESEKVADLEVGDYLSKIVVSTTSTMPPINNKGRILYSQYNEAGEWETFSFQDEKKESLGLNSVVLLPFADSGGILYIKDQQLYYKTAEGTIQFDSEGHTSLPKNPYHFYGDTNLMSDTRFIIDLADTGQEGKVTLYEFDTAQPKKLSKIAVSDRNDYIIDRDYSVVFYSLDDRYYIKHRTEDGWSESKEIQLNLEGLGATGIFMRWFVDFDSTGRYCYCASRIGEDVLKLVKYEIETATETDIFSGFYSFWLTDDVPYALKEDGGLYRADTGELITDHCDSYYPDASELYFRTEGGALYHYNADEKMLTKLAGDIEAVRYDSFDYVYDNVILYEGVLTDEIKAQLSEFCSEAQRCLNLIRRSKDWESEKEGWLVLADNAYELSQREDVPRTARDIFGMFSSGFGWLKDAFYKTYAVDRLTEAVEQCEGYLKL